MYTVTCDILPNKGLYRFDVKPIHKAFPEMSNIYLSKWHDFVLVGGNQCVTVKIPDQISFLALPKNLKQALWSGSIITTNLEQRHV